LESCSSSKPICQICVAALWPRCYSVLLGETLDRQREQRDVFLCFTPGPPKKKKFYPCNTSSFPSSCVPHPSMGFPVASHPKKVFPSTPSFLPPATVTAATPFPDAAPANPARVHRHQELLRWRSMARSPRTPARPDLLRSTGQDTELAHRTPGQASPP
jgi:hypothetical protein